MQTLLIILASFTCSAWNCSMQVPHVFSHLEDLKPSGEGLHSQFGGLKVFDSQFNIGHEVYARWLVREKFGEGGKRKFSKLNLIFVGPSYADLRDQTANDITELAKDKNLCGDVTEKEVMKNVKGMIFNSSNLKGKPTKKQQKKKAVEQEDESDDDDNDKEYVEEPLPKEYDQDLTHIPFLTGLKADAECENLHLIIHDEAHWGIKSKSLLEKFFLRVLGILGQFDPTRCPTLLVLLVSATSDVLFKPVAAFDTSLNVKNLYAVDWNGLNRSGMPQFAVPTYRAVDHLCYRNDVTTKYTQDGKETFLTGCNRKTQRSACVSHQYKTAAHDLCQCIYSTFKQQHQHNVFLGDVMSLSNIHRMLAGLLGCGEKQKAINMSDLCSYKPDRKGIVLVRLASISDANELAAAVKSFFYQCCDFLPFEVISLGGNNNINKELSARGRECLLNTYGVIVDDSSRVAVLENIPTLLIVVNKLQMGERLPSSCYSYDVRVPYRGPYDKVETGTETKFVQDVGRLAGHKTDAPMPVVLLALDVGTTGNGAHPRNSMPAFQKPHELLTADSYQPTKSHSEYKGNANIYSKMLQYSVLLNASPQIGKTGSFLAVIEILFDNHIIGTVYVPPEPEADAMQVVTPPPVEWILSDDFGTIDGTFAQRCTYLRHLLRTEGMSALQEVMKKDYFVEYHNLLMNSRLEQEKNTNDLIIFNVLFRLRTELEQASWRILDCGCGIHGLAPSLNAMMQQGVPKQIKKLEHVYVRGVDLDDAIRDCIPAPTHGRLTFEPVVDDFLSVPVDAEGYDLVVFNCSLWQQSNLDVLSWANRNLRIGGHLVVVDLKSRLPLTWKDDLVAMGWAVSTEFEELQYSVFEYAPYIMSVWQKPNANELKEGRDLLMVDC